MRPVLIVSYNCLPLLKKCVESVRTQDIPTYTLVYDNGSTDGSSAWLPKNDEEDKSFQAFRSASNLGVTKAWNWGLRYLFSQGAEHVLVLNQDLVLPSYFYSELLNCNLPLVTGYPVESMELLRTFNLETTPHPCYSAFLIRRECWERVGEFDERYFSWCNDCDHHVRCHLKGVRAEKANVPFLHFPGTTMRTAPEPERQWFGKRADADRAVFKEKYGTEPGQPGYEDLFLPDLFGAQK